MCCYVLLCVCHLNTNVLLRVLVVKRACVAVCVSVFVNKHTYVFLRVASKARAYVVVLCECVCHLYTNVFAVCVGSEVRAYVLLCV